MLAEVERLEIVRKDTMDEDYTHNKFSNSINDWSKMYHSITMKKANINFV